MRIREPDAALPTGVVSEPAASTAVEAPAKVDAAVAVAPPARAEVERAVERANRQIASLAPALEFEVDAESHQVVIRLVDRHDRRVLRQVPTPEMLAIAKALDRMQTLLVRARA